jgi:PHD/YefM family antitoxin component YafN of YafNO toxin-antitoxin module
MNTVTANELKTKGISAVEAHLKHESEVFISIRGQNKYVVINAEKYAEFREFELEQAIKEARDDLEAGRFNTDSVEQHLRTISGK